MLLVQTGVCYKCKVYARFLRHSTRRMSNFISLIIFHIDDMLKWLNFGYVRLNKMLLNFISHVSFSEYWYRKLRIACVVHIIFLLNKIGENRSDEMTGETELSVQALSIMKAEVTGAWDGVVQTEKADGEQILDCSKQNKIKQF